MSKLVRDRIPDIIRARGAELVTHIADAEEYVAALKEKVVEEAQELRSADGDHEREEIADVLEVLRALAAARGIRWTEVERIAAEKTTERGGFMKRVILEKLE